MLEVTGSLIKPHGRVIEQLNSLVSCELHIAKLHIEDRDERINLSLGLPILYVSSGMAGLFAKSGSRTISFFIDKMSLTLAAVSQYLTAEDIGASRVRTCQ